MPKAKTTKKTAAPNKKISGLKTAMTKTEIIAELVDKTELSKKEIQSVLDEISIIIERHVKKKSVGEFTLPGLFKILVKKKPATKAKKGINPFTGEETIFKAKPASNAIKIRPLKKLKDMAL